jgi:hypothetical protein
MKTAVIILGLFLIQNISFCQDDIDGKYLMALLYLKTNEDINKEIKTYIQTNSKKKEKFINFKVSSRIEYIRFNYFDDILKNKEFGIDSTLFEDHLLFDSAFTFPPYEVSGLDDIIDSKNSKVILYFSKPMDNLLVAEIRHENSNFGKYKMGNVVILLFIFKGNLIDEVHSTMLHYM